LIPLVGRAAISDVNCGPLSVVIICGTPFLANTLIRKLITSLEVIVSVASASTHLVK